MSKNESFSEATWSRTLLSIPRPRIQERLEAAIKYRITLITAPAGFGKSAALRELSQNHTRFVLYTVSTETSTLVEFVRGLCDSLASRIPMLRASLPSAVAAIGSSTNPGKELGSWVNVHLADANYIIAIDNLDASITNRDVSSFLITITELTRQNVKWIFSSRGSTSLPTTSWLGYEDMDLAIDADDLRFDEDEIKASAALSNIVLSKRQLKRLSDFTQGWPVAISFAIRTLPKTHDLDSLANKTGDLMYRFLAEQVWGSLDQSARDFLTVAAFLPRIDPQIINAAGHNADVLLKHVQARVGLLSTGTSSYELHRLFRDFIVAHLHSLGEEHVRQARRSAGKLLDTIGRGIDALEQFIDAEAIPDVERLLTRYNFSLFDSGHIDTIERAIHVLECTGSASACALRAAIEESRGRVGSAESLYLRALESTQIELTFRVAVAWRYSLLLYQQRRTDAIPILRDLGECEDLSDSDRAQITGSLAVLLAFSGDHDLARSAISQAIALTRDVSGPLRARTLGRASTVAFFTGNTQLVERYAREAAQIAEECSMFALSARIKTSLSTLHTSAGRLGIAASYAVQVVNDAEKAGDAELRVRGLRELLVLETERGDEKHVAVIEAILHETSYDGPVGLIGLLVSRGMRFICKSQFNDAIEALSHVPTDDLSWHQHRVRLALLAIAKASNGLHEDLIQAFELYDYASKRDTTEHPMFDRERALSLRYMALAALLASDVRRSKTYQKTVTQISPPGLAFDQALDAIAARSPNGLDTALLKLGRLHQGGVASVIRASSIRLFDKAPGQESLTPTEALVLRALGEGFSNKAIANANGSTVNTVRSQVSTVLKKLGCSSRGEAVALALKRKLI